ncbi:MAG: nitroreductase family protein [Proteobacteria bacterium]|nr:nitroreductase family protein [Pseudomonadota bacterium]
MNASISTLHEIISNRISKRALNPSSTINTETLVLLAEAARWAPSCNNEQPWRFIFWNKSQNLKAWENAFSCLADGNKTWVQNAPVLAVSLAYELNNKGLPNRWAQYDTGSAAQNLCLQATALGLIAHQMGGFDSQQLRKNFHLPHEITPMAMIAIGYPGDAQQLPEKLRQRETAPRERRASGELFFNSEWGQPLKR